MKNTLLLLFIAFILVSCGGNNSDKNKDKETRESEPQSDSTALEKSYEWNYYAGTLGIYGDNVVLEIAVDSNKIIGGYWYLKHGKMLTLKGETAPKSSEWKLTESFDNKITGKFVLQNQDDSLIGTWYPPNSKEAQPVALRRVIKNKKEKEPLNFERYAMKHTILMRGMDEDVEEEVQDEFLCVRLGDYLQFSYEVTGDNAHMGFIEGLAKFKSDKKAVFYGESDCELTIEFKENAVEIDESSCYYYRGMRAYFGGKLTKKR